MTNRLPNSDGIKCRPPNSHKKGLAGADCLLDIISKPQPQGETMTAFQEIQAKLLKAKVDLNGGPVPSAAEIIDEMLAELASLEADFHTLCREVASLSIDHFSKAYATTPEFDQMLDRRGVVLPVL